ILLHNLDRVWSLITTTTDPDQFHENVSNQFWYEMRDCVFSNLDIDTIFHAVMHHGQPYNEAPRSELQRRLQQLDMISRLNCLLPMAAGVHHGEKEVFKFDAPWLADMAPEDRFRMSSAHSVYTIHLGVVLSWVRQLPE